MKFITKSEYASINNGSDDESLILATCQMLGFHHGTHYAISYEPTSIFGGENPVWLHYTERDDEIVCYVVCHKDNPLSREYSSLVYHFFGISRKEMLRYLQQASNLKSFL